MGGSTMAHEPFSLSVPAKVIQNLGYIELLEHAVRRGEGRLASTGAFVVETGTHTGRSAQDKFTVRNDITEKQIWWENNKSITQAQFDSIYADFQAHARTRELYVQDLHAGADARHLLKARIFCEYAWHAAFIRHLLRRPEAKDLANFTPEFTVSAVPQASFVGARVSRNKIGRAHV